MWYEAGKAPSRRLTSRGIPPASHIAIVTFHPFDVASCSAALMAFSTAADFNIIVSWKSDGSSLALAMLTRLAGGAQRQIARIPTNRVFAGAQSGGITQKDVVGQTKESKKATINNTVQIGTLAAIILQQPSHPKAMKRAPKKRKARAGRGGAGRRPRAYLFKDI